MERQVAERLKQDPFANYLGIEWIEMEEGRAVAILRVADHMLNAHGTAHGAVIFALADAVFAASSNSYGKVAVALSMNIGYLAPALVGDTLRATSVETAKTSRTAWYRITVESGGVTVAILDALAYRKKEAVLSEGEGS